MLTKMGENPPPKSKKPGFKREKVGNSVCKIFVIEGPDYAGKTTLIKSLFDYLKSNGKRVAIFKEPDGEIRQMLLDKNGNLSFATRRNLFAADHLQTLDTIYEVKNKYDYIFMDRSTVISDVIYSSFESGSEYLSSNISGMMQKQFDLIDRVEYDNFFKCNTHLILLKLSKQELINRMYRRSIDKNDIFDIKSDDFKIEVWRRYNELTNKLMNSECSNIYRLFSDISSVEVDDNLFNNVIKIVNGG